MQIKCSIDEVKRLRPEELKRILERDRKGEFVLVDVRQPEEYETGHIPGARLIPLGELEVRNGELEKDKKIVTYCRSGHRSMGAAILLCGSGFKDVYTMDGGMLDWYYEILKGLSKERPELITGKEVVGNALIRSRDGITPPSLAWRIGFQSWSFSPASNNISPAARTASTRWRPVSVAGPFRSVTA